VREDHPLLDGEITAERYAGYSHISMSRRGIARGPIDTALNALGLERRVAVIAPASTRRCLPADSDLILPVPKEALLSVRAGPEAALVQSADPVADADADPGLAPALRQGPGAPLAARNAEGLLR
jgi:hypothetical protein